MSFAHEVFWIACVGDYKGKNGETGTVFRHKSNTVGRYSEVMRYIRGDRGRQKEKLQLNGCYRQTGLITSLSAFSENRARACACVWKGRITINMLKHRSINTFGDHTECLVHKQELSGGSSLRLKTWLPLFKFFWNSQLVSITYR
jgi:hypothetical protein